MIAVIDLDGTLIDSTKRHYVLMERLLEQRGLLSGFDASAYMDYKADGHSGKSYLTNVLHLENSVATGVMTKWTAHIEDEELISLDELYEDAIPFLEYLKNDGIKIIFLTARQDAMLVRSELEHLCIADFADEIFVVSPSNGMAEKCKVCKELKMQDEIFVVGDTENEEQLVSELGIDGFILNRGFRSRKFWDEKGVKTFESLLEIRR